MTPSRRNVPALPVPLLRDAIGRETARMSLRRAATAISISPNGLRNFLNGSAPRSATRAKLERWLAEQQHVSRPPNVGQLVRLLNELAGDLSTQQTAALAGDIARCSPTRTKPAGCPHPAGSRTYCAITGCAGAKQPAKSLERARPCDPDAPAVDLLCEVCAVFPARR